MKKLLTILVAILFITSCKQGKPKIILPHSTGTANEVLVVLKGGDWDAKVGDEVRNVLGEHQVGLPQPETLFTVTQIDPKGFSGFMRNFKSILIFTQGENEKYTVTKNRFASPQTIITVTAKDNEGYINVLKTKGKEIIKIFQTEDVKILQRHFAKNSLDDSKYKTMQDLGLSLIIPDSYRTVDDTGEFLWLRQHLNKGLRGDGTSNILVYTVPLEDETTIANNITAVRDSIGKKYIPGSKEGMYMITEQAYTPFTYKATIDGKDAYETRGKWEVKNDFMAGPFLNYTVIDKKNNRLIVFEGFTFAPSINKRDFIFELEAIGRSLKIK